MSKTENKPKQAGPTGQDTHYSSAPKLKWQHIMLIVILGFAVYANSLNNKLLLNDDRDNIINNSFIKDWGNLPGLFSSEYFVLAQERTYRPVVTLSYFINYSLSGLNLAGWRLVNILFHVINGVLVYLLINLIMNKRTLALVTALLFCLHPIHTEALNIISFREDLLSLFFFLLAFIYYIIYLRKQRRALYALSLVFFLLAVFTKEMALTLPAILVLYDYYFRLENKPKWRSALTGIFKAPVYRGYFAIVAVFIVQKLFLLKPSGFILRSDASIPANFPGGSLLATLLTLPKIIVYYIGMLLLPLKLSLIHYDKIQVSSTLGIMTIVSLIILACIFAVVIKARIKELSFATLFFFIALSPVSNLVPVGLIMAERYMYFPAIGFCLLCAIVFIRTIPGDLIKKNIIKKAALVSIIAVLSFYGIRTYARNADYKDAYTFWSKILVTNPGSAAALNKLGIHYADTGDFNKAIAKFTESLAIEPNYSDAYINRAAAYKSLKNYGRALNDLNEAIVLNPGEADPYYLRSIIYLLTGKFDLVLESVEKAIDLSPGTIEYLDLKATILYERNMHEEALACTGELLKIDANHYRAQLIRIAVLLRQNRLAEALAALGRLEKNPAANKALVYYNYGCCYSLMKEKDKMLEYLVKAIALDSSFKNEAGKDMDFNYYRDDADFKNITGR